MEGSQVDALALALTDVRSRRSLGRLAAALSLIGSAAALPWREAAAEPHRNKRKKRKKKVSQSTPSSPSPAPGQTCAGKLVSGRCVLDCGTTCQSKNGQCANDYQDSTKSFCFPVVANACQDYAAVCTQDSGCAPTELCAMTNCGPGGAGQGRCVLWFPPS